MAASPSTQNEPGTHPGELDTASENAATGPEAERWDPEGGEAVVSDDLTDAELLSGTSADGLDLLLAGEFTQDLIAGLAEAGPGGDLTEAILATLPALPESRD